MTPDCTRLSSWETRVDYYAGVLARAEEAEIEEHVFACDTCAHAFDEVARLVEGALELAGTGALLWGLDAPGLARLQADGVRISEARVAPGGSLRVEFDEETELLIGRLEGDFEGIERVDVEFDREGYATEEQEVPVASPRELLIACTLHARESLVQLRAWRTLCRVRRSGDPTRAVLAEYWLSIDRAEP